jgi:hypothetical protein
MTSVTWTPFFEAVKAAIEKRRDALLIIETSDQQLLKFVAPDLRPYQHSELRPGWVDLLEQAAERADAKKLTRLRSEAMHYPTAAFATELQRIAEEEQDGILSLRCINDSCIASQVDQFLMYLPNWKLRFFVDVASNSEPIRPSNCAQEFERGLKDLLGLNIPHTDAFPFAETTMQAIAIGTRCNTRRTDALLKDLVALTNSSLIAEHEQRLRAQQKQAEFDNKSSANRPVEQTEDIQRAITAPRLWQSDVIKAMIEFLHPDLVRWAKSQQLLEEFYFACARVANSEAGTAPVWYASELLPPRLKAQLEDPDFCGWLRRFEGQWNPPSPLTFMDDSPGITRFLLNSQQSLRLKSSHYGEWSLSEGFRQRAKIQINQVMKMVSDWLATTINGSGAGQVRERLTLVRCLIPIVRYCPATHPNDEPEKNTQPGRDEGAHEQLQIIVDGLKQHLNELFKFSWTERLGAIQSRLNEVGAAHEHVISLFMENRGVAVVDATLKELQTQISSDSCFALAKLEAQTCSDCENLLLAIKSKLSQWLTELDQGPTSAQEHSAHISEKLKPLVEMTESSFKSCKITLTKIHDQLSAFPTEQLRQLDSALVVLQNAHRRVTELLKDASERWANIEATEKRCPSFAGILKARWAGNGQNAAVEPKLHAVAHKLERALCPEGWPDAAQVSPEDDTAKQDKSSWLGSPLKALHATETLLRMLTSEIKDVFSLSERHVKALIERLDSELTTLDTLVRRRRDNTIALHTPAIDALEIEVLLLQRQLAAAIQQSKVTTKAEKENQKAKKRTSFAQIERKIVTLEATQKRHPVIPIERVKLLRAEWLESKDRFDMAISAYQAICDECEYLLDPVLWRLAYYGALRCRMSARSLPEHAVLSRLLAFADVQDLRSKDIDSYGKGGNLVVFPSFRGSIRAEVAALCKSVRGSEDNGGLSLFVDHDRNESEDFDPVIYERLLSADIAIVFITEDYFSSPWCKAELTLLLQQNRFRGTQLYYVNVDLGSMQSNVLNTESQYFNNDRMDRLREYGEQLVPEVIGRGQLLSEHLQRVIGNAIKRP